MALVLLLQMATIVGCLLSEPICKLLTTDNDLIEHLKQVLIHFEWWVAVGNSLRELEQIGTFDGAFVPTGLVLQAARKPTTQYPSEANKVVDELLRAALVDLVA